MVRLTGATMGTRWYARIVSREPAGALREAILAALDGVIAEMSNWEADSAISCFNRAPPGTWLHLPPDFAHVLDAGLAIAAATDGAFDPAAGALVDLWGFGPAGPRALPPPAAALDMAVSGWRSIERDGARARRTAAARLDLSGIAKGFGADATARALRKLGLTDFLIDVGGEVIGAGVKPDGQPWWIDLEDPPGMRLAPFRIALHDLAVASSGDYRRFFTADGRRHSHSIDPRTRYPIDNGVAAVSVLHPDCMMADGWATALTILGPEPGMALAAREGLAVRMILRGTPGREILSPALGAMLG